MWKRLFIAVVCLLLANTVYAQKWTKEDSLRLNKMLKQGEELKLNKEAVKRIRFNQSDAEDLRISDDKRWMRFDESLPRIASPSSVVESDTLYNRRKQITDRKLPFLTLHSYDSIARLPLRTLKISMDFTLPPPPGLSLGGGVRVNGGLFSGLDLMKIFTKEFWQVRKRRTRTRTLEALKEYKVNE